MILFRICILKFQKKIFFFGNEVTSRSDVSDGVTCQGVSGEWNFAFRNIKIKKIFSNF